MVLAIPRVKPLGWVDDELLTAAQITQMDLNISLLDGAFSIVYASAMQQFIRTDLASGTDTINFLTPVQQTVPIGHPDNRQKSIFVGGRTPGSLAIGQLLNDGLVPPAAYGSIAGAVMNSAPAADKLGNIFVGISGSTSTLVTGIGVAVSSATVTGMTTGAEWVGFTDVHYLAFEFSTSKLYNATALGGTWSSQTIPVTYVSGLTTNGAGTWVLFGHSSGSSHIMCSTDDGVTFTNVETPGGVGSNVSGGWSPSLGKFVALEKLAGALWTSTDGITWAVSRTSSALANIPFTQQTVACCGNVIACIVNRPINSLGRYPNGIAYTTDGGATWNESYIGGPLLTDALTSLISANGRLYALDGKALLQSGVLVAQPTLFTGV